MKLSDIQVEDCWVDEKGNHWFCKVIQTTQDTFEDELGLSYMGLRMVKYLDRGMRLLTKDQFKKLHPHAVLYLRQGIHT
jgi:hypothetical protein